MLDAISGFDADDPRQCAADIPDTDYTEAADADLEGLTVGLLEEGFGLADANPRVDETVRVAVERFEEVGVGLTGGWPRSRTVP